MSPWLSDLFLRSQSDERLVALARAGQQRAFTAIVERYSRELQSYARRLDGERAEDLVQQAFLCAFAALQADTDVRHLRGWLFQILRNVAARTSASRTLDNELQGTQAVTESAQQIAERRMLAVDALAAVAQLPDRQHDAIVQTALQGRSRTEVAHLMGLSEGAVRQLVHRARETLRTAITAITPLPLARWLGNLQAGAANGLPEISAGAGAAAASGVAVKIGALVATGALATGVISVVSPHHAARPHGHAAAGRSGSAGAARHIATGVNGAQVALAGALAGSGGGRASERAHGDSGQHSGGDHSGGGDLSRRGDLSGGGDRSSGGATSGSGPGPSGGGSTTTSGSSGGGSSTQPIALSTSDGGTSGGSTSGSSGGGTSGGSTTTSGSSDGGTSGGTTTTSGSSDGGSTTTTGTLTTNGGGSTSGGGPGPS
jgi:RNA polymerase sigma factor (sigma-70 family)